METILRWIEKFATGKNRKIFWITLFVVVVFVTIIYPFVDARFFMHKRIAQRIENLGALIEISDAPLDSNPILIEEYNSILQQMKEGTEITEQGIFSRNDTKKEQLLKFIGGGLWGFIIAIYGLFYREKEKKETLGEILLGKFAVILVGLIIGVILGYIFMMIPTLGTAWVNLLLAPVCQLVIIVILCADLEDAQC